VTLSNLRVKKAVFDNLGRRGDLAAMQSLRGELLVLMKGEVGLTYREIAEMDIFGDSSINSLGTL